MPLHDYQCDEGHVFERAVPLVALSQTQRCDCGEVARRLPCAPRITPRDEIAPCWGADGKQHSSLASYRNSLLPQNNAKGERFIEMGTEAAKPYVPPPICKKTRRDDVARAIADIKKGKPVPRPTEGVVP